MRPETALQIAMASCVAIVGFPHLRASFSAAREILTLPPFMDPEFWRIGYMLMRWFVQRIRDEGLVDATEALQEMKIELANMKAELADLCMDRIEVRAHALEDEMNAMMAEGGHVSIERWKGLAAETEALAAEVKDQRARIEMMRLFII